MFSYSNMPSASYLLATYASMTASVMLVRSMANELLPTPVRNYAVSTIQKIFKSRSNELTLVIEDNNGMNRNQIFEASEIYLSTKINANTERVKIFKTPKEKNVTMRLEKNEKIVDSYQGVELKWKFVQADPEKNGTRDIYPRMEKRSFELTFHKKHIDLVMGSYVPYVLEEAKVLREEQRVLKMFTLNNTQEYAGGCIKWDSVNMEHPATFETLAMDSDLKKEVLEDLNRFVRRKDYYKRVGRAWKRGYLLYGPPGTGKSSLVAAMANYLKFDVYDLQLGNVMRDSDLRRLLLTTGNRSILVIEDIDCSIDLPDRRQFDESDESDEQEEPPAKKRRTRGSTRNEKAQTGGSNGRFMLTLSGLLNFIDGLWSSCGDERIIVFTTNHKERLDPALLRPGRMDKHIHMSYCSPDGFKLLASNYLGITGEHVLYKEIESIIESTSITPAQVAEELMKSEAPDVALEGLLKILKRKQLDGDETASENGTRQSKRLKPDNKRNKKTVGNTKRKRTGRRKS